MFSFWRYTIAFTAVIASSIIFFFLVKTSVYDIQFSDSLPPKGIQNIPPTDTILPNIFAKIPPPPSSTPTSSLPNSSSPTRAKQIKQPQQTSSSQSSLNFQGAVSPQQCFDYAKNCRDVQCAFQRFNVICDNNGIGPTCTCGMGQTSGASSIQSIQSNAHFVFLVTFIFYQFC